MTNATHEHIVQLRPVCDEDAPAVLDAFRSAPDMWQVLTSRISRPHPRSSDAVVTSLNIPRAVRYVTKGWKMNRTIRNATIWLATLTVAGFAAVPAWAEPGETDGPEQIGDIEVALDDSSIDTRAELDAYIQSDEAKTVTVDRATGEMTSVVTGNEPVISPFTSVTNHCTSTSHVCTISGQVPRPNYGFTGVGTKTGVWLGQNAFLTKSHAGKGYYSWNGSTVALPKIGANSRINLDGPATFVKVIVY